jgi:hypothetical protein
MESSPKMPVISPILSVRGCSTIVYNEQLIEQHALLSHVSKRLLRM